MNRKNLNAIFVHTKNIDVILKNKITKKKTRNTLRKVTWEKWAWKLDGVSGVLGHVPKFDPPKNQAHCLSVRPRRCWMLKSIPKRETPVTTSGDTSKNNPSNWQVRALMSQWMTSIECMNEWLTEWLQVHSLQRISSEILDNYKLPGFSDELMLDIVSKTLWVSTARSLQMFAEADVQTDQRTVAE